MRAAATVVATKRIAIFDEVPELLGGVSAAGLAELSRVRTRSLLVERGSWHPPALHANAQYHFGLLVLDGVMLRRVLLNGRTGAELLGSGDLLQPWVRQSPYDTLAADSAWEVLERSRLAVLDQRFAARVAPWPEVAAALLTRGTRRARMLAFQNVASHFPRLESRILALMWAVADRWGRVTQKGVLIPVRLTHAALAELVGASRPSVSAALSQLARDRILERASGGWLLDPAVPYEGGTAASTGGISGAVAPG